MGYDWAGPTGGVDAAGQVFTFAKPVERPILFKDRLVQAILRNEKTQTRRVGPAAKRWLKAEPGDILWVREAWADICNAGDERCWGPDDPEHLATYHRYEYRADTGNPRPGDWPDEPGAPAWKPSIHMPRMACRLRLVLTEKPRLEPLQKMRHEDFLAEGIDRTNSSVGWIVEERFRQLWDSVNAERGFGWATNPEVVVLTFKPVSGNKGGES